MNAFSLIDAIMSVTARNPDRSAFNAPGASLTFAEMVRQASQCARYLARRGVEAGDRVAIATAKPDQTLVAVFACWMLGATAMVLDFRTRGAERSEDARTFGLKAIVEARSLKDSSGYLSVPVGDSLADTVAAEDDTPVIRPADIHPAFIVRTSGTTGAPQGVLYTHATFMARHWGLSRGYMGHHRGPLFHAMPLQYAAGFMITVSQLLDGGTTYILPMIASADEIADAIVASGAEIVLVVPPQLEGLLRISAGRTTPMFPNVRVMTSGGAKTPIESSLRAYRELTNGYRVSYGVSFAGAISSLSGDDLLRKPHTVGQPYDFNHVQVVDADNRPVGPGEPGLIRIRSVTTADAIIGARTDSDRFVDGWAYPGDTGYLDDEGFLVLTGRASDMIIRKGVNVYPREIEDVLERHDAVAEAAVVGFQSAVAGEEVAAFVVVRRPIGEDELMTYARANLVADKRPRAIRIVEQLPRSDAGKVLKRVLAERMIETETT